MRIGAEPVVFARPVHASMGNDRRNVRPIGVPAAMWTVAAFFAVVRYLSYLDLRIRREGWEVELQVRAEAERLTRQPV